MDPVALLERLSNAFGPTSHEDEVRDIVLEVVTPLADEVTVDRLGSVIATRTGKRDDVLLLDAHTDEIGFLVSAIDEEGFLRLFPLGGWDARILPSHALTVKPNDGTMRRGVVGTLPPHVLTPADRERPHKLEELWLDVGARSADEVRAMGIDVGTPCVPHYGFERLDDDLVMGKAFDNRAGCVAVAAALHALKDHDLEMSLACSFSTAEEVGLRGARVVANRVQPAVMLALECTTGTDVPGVQPTQRLAVMGSGPAVSIADRSAIAARPVVELLEDVAATGKIAYHRKLPGGGGTDAGAVQTAGLGALCGVVSVPGRYIHTPLTLLRPSDLAATIDLTVGFSKRAHELL